MLIIKGKYKFIDYCCFRLFRFKLRNVCNSVCNSESRMATNKLSSTGVKALLNAPHDKAKAYADGNGLSVRVTPAKTNGENSLLWLYRYRLGGRGSQQKTIVLGSYPELTLAAARAETKQCRQWLAEGKDPSNERDLSRQTSLKPISVSDALNIWLDKYANDKRKNAVTHQQQFNRWIIPKVGNLPISQISKPHWLDCFESRAKSYPVAAGYVLRNVQQALKYVQKRGYEVNSDIFDLDFDTIGASAQAKRSRRLISETSWQELVDLLRHIESGKLQPYYQAMLKILIVFGCRSQEIRLSKVDEWDFDAMVWTVPAAHNKTGDKDQKRGDTGEILRPIPDQLRPWLMSLAENSRNGFMLGELKESTAVSQWGLGIWKKLGHSQKWGLHDLRRTVATGLNDLGVAPHVVEALLGHSIQGVAGIYNRSQYLPEKRQALELWTQRLQLLISYNHSNLLIGNFGHG